MIVVCLIVTSLAVSLVVVCLLVAYLAVSLVAVCLLVASLAVSLVAVCLLVASLAVSLVDFCLIVSSPAVSLGVVDCQISDIKAQSGVSLFFWLYCEVLICRVDTNSANISRELVSYHYKTRRRCLANVLYHDMNNIIYKS